MDILNPKSLRQQAETSLRRGREPQKLIYTFAGISLAISVAIFLANLWLDDQISGTGGLGNLGTRAIFSTIQQSIPVLSSVVAMCLDLGFLGGLMRISRGQYADHTDLKTGFRKLWPLVRLVLLQMALYLAIAFLAFQLGGLIFTFTPWAGPLMEVLYPLYESGAANIEEAVLLELMGMMIPMFIITCIVFLVILTPFLYRMRMAYFCLLDDPRGRAMAAIRESSRMMRRRFGQMLKIDLSLWLYYAANVLMWVVLYADLIMAVLGIPFPVKAEIFSFLVYAAAVLIQFAIHAWVRPTAELTYLNAYDALREKSQDSGVVLGNIFDM